MTALGRSATKGMPAIEESEGWRAMVGYFGRVAKSWITAITRLASEIARLVIVRAICHLSEVSLLDTSNTPLSGADSPSKPSRYSFLKFGLSPSLLYHLCQPKENLTTLASYYIH